MGEEVLQKYRSLLRRAAWVRGWDAFLEAAFLLTMPAALLVLAERLAFELDALNANLCRPAAVAVILGGALALAGVAGLVRLAAGSLPSAAVAWAADRSLATDGLFLSAVEFASSGARGGFEALVVEQAAVASRRIEPRRVVPSPRVGYRWAIGLALLTGAALVLLPPRIAPAPIAKFSAEPTRGSAPLEVRFEESAIGYIGSYEWDFGDGSGARGRILHHVYEKPGRYVVSLAVSGPGGTHRVEREAVEVLPREHVVADFVPVPDKGRLPLRVEFRNLSSRADEFRWSFGDGASSLEREPAHTYTRPGKFSVELEVEGGGSKDRVAREVRVVGPDAPLADFAAYPTKGPAPLAVHFESRATGEISSHEWDFGDPLDPSSDRVDPVHIYKMPGTYTVKLKVKGPGGEDVEIKERYIKVEDQGGGGGGGADKPEGQKGGASPQTVLSLSKKPEKRPKVDAIPHVVKVPGSGPMVEKKKNVFTAPDREGGGGEKPWEEAFRRYQKAAEEALSREAIPESLRDYVRKYFEVIRPR